MSYVVFSGGLYYCCVSSIKNVLPVPSFSLVTFPYVLYTHHVCVYIILAVHQKIKYISKSRCENKTENEFQFLVLT